MHYFLDCIFLNAKATLLKEHRSTMGGCKDDQGIRGSRPSSKLMISWIRWYNIVVCQHKTTSQKCTSQVKVMMLCKEMPVADFQWASLPQT